MTYNGWTNYETWNANLHYEELLDSMANDGEEITAELIKDTVYEIEYDRVGHGGLASDALGAFLDEVNWDEIASHYQEEEEAA